MARFSPSITCLVALAAALAAPSPASADVQPGDKPAMKFKVMDSTTDQTISLTDLRGKIVVVEFWASYCPVCMEQAPHMVAINKQYGARGVQLIGIDCDKTEADARKVVQEKHFTWPIAFGNYFGDWNVTGIPQAFIIGPDGTVLWRGSPAEMDQPLAKAYRAHPPVVIDPQVLTAAKTDLDQVEADLSANEPVKAVKAMTAVPEVAKLDPNTGDRIKEIAAKLDAYGQTRLDAAGKLVDDKQYAPAAIELTTLSKLFAGTPTGIAATKKLTAIARDPEGKKAIAAAKLADKAAADLKLADKAKADKKDDRAYPLYQKIVATYPGTPAADEAADDIKIYEADEVFITKYTTAANAKKAATALLTADGDRQNGLPEKAKDLYKKVIADYPDTPSAAKAKQALLQLGA